MTFERLPAWAKKQLIDGDTDTMCEGCEHAEKGDCTEKMKRECREAAIEYEKDHGENCGGWVLVRDEDGKTHLVERDDLAEFMVDTDEIIAE